MAAALIPLALQAAPSIIDLIVSLVHKHAPTAEQKHGPGTGPVKFADVFASVTGDLTQAADVGAIDKTLPSDDTIKSIIQIVVTSLNKLGALTRPIEPPPAQVTNIVLKVGQSITLTGVA